MPPDAEALRAILKQYVGPAYDRALRNTGDDASAREATRRTMELLKRACESGVEPSKALVLRITDDCCDEKAFYNRQLEAEVSACQSRESQAQSLGACQVQAPRAAQVRNGEGQPHSEPRHMPPAQESAYPGSASSEEAAYTPPTQGISLELAEAEPAPFPSLMEETPAAKREKKRRKVTPGSALLVMFLSLVVVLLSVMLVVMLISTGILPDGQSGLGSEMAAWFNTHIFPLF